MKHTDAQSTAGIPQDSYDVLVVGSGLAGIVAAIEAARVGAHTAIACAGNLFGGSSFYPGTWGLGLVGPLDTADEDDLIQTILDVGCGVAEPLLVETFVRGIRPAIAWLENDLGVTLKRPSNEQCAEQAAFIPCFDHRLRLWRGIERDAFISVMQREIKRLNIAVLEHCELMALEPSKNNGTPRPLFFNHTTEKFETLHARAVVLAGGGTSGIFDHRLTSNDVLSSIHGIAVAVGCKLINLEFMQMMPGLVRPIKGIVYNEKAFCYASLNEINDMLPDNEAALKSLLDTRSGHGPFTCRLGDEAVDLTIHAAGDNGLEVKHHFPVHDIPEFVQTYSDWLLNTHGIKPSDPVRVAMYAHASNGGIRITPQAETDIAGLYACGEATGGMHGADRIGGLSSANGLVFGRIAGHNAAEYARAQGEILRSATGSKKDVEQMPHDLEIGSREPNLDSFVWSVLQHAPLLHHDEAQFLTQQLRHIMSTYAMVKRSEDGLVQALEQVHNLAQTLEAYKTDERSLSSELDNNCAHDDDRLAPIYCDNSHSQNLSQARGMRLCSQLQLAQAMLQAMLARKESLGSHYRTDYPPACSVTNKELAHE